MANSFAVFLKKIERECTMFAKSKLAVPVLIGALAVMAGSVLVVLALQDHPSEQGNSASVSVPTSNSTIDKVYDEVEDDKEYTNSNIDAGEYLDTILHESEDAGEEYTKNTLFLGDSNTYRYMNYGFADLSNAVGVIGMGAGAIDNLGCVKFKTYRDYVTMPKAMPILQPQRVVFGFGTNNLGGDVNTYIKSYAKGIQACYDAYPYFDVIVTAIPPVDVNRSYTNVTMQQIDKFNGALVSMCEENGWKFLNTSEVLKNPNTGFAKTEYTVSDGLHLSLEGCTALFDYIRTHAYETQDRRPTPLKDIPARDETPPDLITVDPLKTEGSTTTAVQTVDVYFAAGTGGSIQGATDQTIEKGGITSQVTAVAAENYVFLGWNCSYEGVSNKESPNITYTAPADISGFGGVVITAEFLPVYPVKFVLAGAVEGASLSATEVIVYYAGGEASSTLTLKDGYTAKVDKGTLQDGVLRLANVTTPQIVTITVSVRVEASPSPSPSISPSPAPVATPEPSKSPEPSKTPTPAASPTTAPVASPTPVVTETPTATQEPVATATPAPTATQPTAAPTVAPTASPTAAVVAPPAAVAPAPATPTPAPTAASTPAPTAPLAPAPAAPAATEAPAANDGLVTGNSSSDGPSDVPSSVATQVD